MGCMKDDDLARLEKIRTKLEVINKCNPCDWLDYDRFLECTVCGSRSYVVSWSDEDDYPTEREDDVDAFRDWTGED